MKGKDNFNGALYNDLYARALRRQMYIRLKNLAYLAPIAKWFFMANQNA